MTCLTFELAQAGQVDGRDAGPLEAFALSVFIDDSDLGQPALCVSQTDSRDQLRLTEPVHGGRVVVHC